MNDNDSRKIAYSDAHSSSGAVVHPQLNLQVQAKGLKVPENTYSICVVSTPSKDSYYKPVTMTEAIQNEKNPFFKTVLSAMYKFEMVQPIRFSIFNVKTPELDLQDLSKVDCVGQADIDLSLLAFNKSKKAISVPLHKPNEPKPIGDFLISPSQSLHCGALFYGTMTLKSLQKPKKLNSINPFFVIYKVTHIVPKKKLDEEEEEEEEEDFEDTDSYSEEKGCTASSKKKSKDKDEKSKSKNKDEKSKSKDKDEKTSLLKKG